MNIVKYIYLSAKSFFSRPLRAVMCIISVAIGTFSVMLLTIVGQLGLTTVEGELKKSGLGGLLIHSNAGTRMDTQAARYIYMTDGIEQVAPVIMGNARLATSNSEECVSWALDENARDVIALEPVSGRFFSADEFVGFHRVCLIDEAVEKTVFKGESAVGKALSVKLGDKTVCMKIVGVIKTGGGILQNFSALLPNMVFFPYETYVQLTGVKGFTQIAVRAEQGTSDEKIASELALKLTDLDGSIVVENLAKQKENLENVLSIITLVLTGVGAVCVLVSAIGITVTLLMSVEERTREIGIKMALGAKKRNIVCEFISEALLVMLCGYTVGTIPAVLLARAAKNALAPGEGIPLEPLAAIFVLTLLLGIVCGAYPAYKAASLSPCKAINKE